MYHQREIMISLSNFKKEKMKAQQKKKNPNISEKFGRKLLSKQIGKLIRFRLEDMKKRKEFYSLKDPRERKLEKKK